ncbi:MULTISPECIES: hypothetical protein [unclassified Roseofilum]|uniref:hypothetical protein n=1 Tax=unclassified Roseofilum TaxID=2620099 RepID=UPI000E994507|nr:MULTISPECIES: hypothetical protein [unclassified Roseofilum]HBQ97086.1 hypothetical protein [Cyanobacteria bacterium UBA11691]MBP0011124.1 hypothetical protein [Roseofilum sp. Belize Diploria]MBP0014077.1 hypothetical protein [Roseofilum sp. SID3]MBP0026702.1 hypothetical protein [Roseofilum sp. SID2]MBP0035796.1 hypothetical protein [Roseofilum sp. Belize BBD 4]
MINGFPKLYKVTLRLFAYHLQTGSLTNTDRIHLSRSDIQAYYEVLLRDYHASDSQGSPLQVQWRSEQPQAQAFDLLEIQADRNRQIQHFILAWLPPIKGFFYPQLFDDSYIGSFTFYLPDLSGKDGLTLAELQTLKPSIHYFSGTTVSAKDNLEEQKRCQVLRTSFLGKTLILSAQLREEPEDLTEFAQICLLSFLGFPSVEAAPPLRNRWRCFKGYVYEFCSPEPDEYYGKIWLFLTFRQESITKLDRTQLELAELFFYDHKNWRNHEDSQGEYQKGLENINKIEQIVQGFTSGIYDDKSADLCPVKLDQLKGNLKILLNISLSYSQNLRSLSDFHKMIDWHRENYEQKIIYIENITDSNLTSTLKLADRQFRKFQQQITANLTYLAEGARLLDTAIATIRGLVEIEQAESDRKLQQQNQDLQDHIQAIGTGIGAGAIAGSSSTLIFKQQAMTFPFFSKHPGAYPHPFVIAVLLSFGFAIIFWAMAKWSLPRILPKKR